MFSNSVTIYFRADLSPCFKDRNLSIIYVVNRALSGFFRLEKSARRGFLAVNVVGDPVTDPEHAANAASDTSEARLIALVRAAAGIPDLPVEIEGISRWRCSADLARSYGKGRIFLAGDAVHLMPPTGGFGGNTGVHDAHNLAWKLAFVLKRVAGPALLDTYEMERRPVGRFTVEQAYTRYVTRTAPYLKATDYQPLAGDFDIELGYLYDSPAVHSEEDASRGHEDPRHSHGRPGSRAPHLWLGSGRRSTLDLFGNGFVVLTASDGWDEAAREISDRYVPLEVHRVDESVAEAYGVGRDGISLIRPDGFVAWRCPDKTGADAARLEMILAKVLMRS